MDNDYLRDHYVPQIYQNSIYSIDYDKLKRKGIKVISFDIDETIAGDNDKYPPKSAVTLFEDLRSKGFTVVLITNNNNTRAKQFGKLLGVNYISDANKPLTKSFYRIIQNNHISAKEMAHVGNNILDDIGGGNSAGITTCLVNNSSGKSRLDEEKKLIAELKKRNIWNGSFN